MTRDSGVRTGRAADASRAGRAGRPAGPAGARRAGRPGPAAPGRDAAASPPGPPAGDGTRRRGERLKLIFFAAAFMAIVAGAAWALLGPSLLVVRSVKVSGASQALRAQVVRAAGIAAGTPLIRLDTGRALRRVERLILVQSAQVSRDWPDTVVITVRPRTAVLALASGGQYELTDRFGVVLRSVPSRPRGLPLLQDLPDEPLRGSAEVRAAALVQRELPAGVRRRVTAIQAPAAGQVSVILRGGVTIVWGAPGQRAGKAAELRILMRRKAVKYIDISDPGSAMTSVLSGPAAVALPRPSPTARRPRTHHRQHARSPRKRRHRPAPGQSRAPRQPPAPKQGPAPAHSPAPTQSVGPPH